MTKNTAPTEYTVQEVLNLIYDPDSDTIATSSTADIDLNTTPANTARTATTEVLPTQHIDAAGIVGGIRPSAYATDDSAMPATPAIMPMGAEFRASPTTYTDGDATVLQSDINGNLKATQATLLAGEMLVDNYIRVRQAFSYSGVVTSDTAVKSGAGFVHSVTFSCTDAAPTVGTISIRDSTSAGAGTIIYTLDVISTTWFAPITIPLDVHFATGLYVDFTTTADVNVVASYE